MNELYWAAIRLSIAVSVVLLQRVGQPEQAQRLNLVGGKIAARKGARTLRSSLELAGLVVIPALASALVVLT